MLYITCGPGCGTCMMYYILRTPYPPSHLPSQRPRMHRHERPRKPTVPLPYTFHCIVCFVFIVFFCATKKFAHIIRMYSGTDMVDLLGQLSVLRFSPLSTKSYFDNHIKRDIDNNSLFLLKKIMVRSRAWVMCRRLCSSSRVGGGMCARQSLSFSRPCVFFFFSFCS
jgi:hypothetical protein